jgi:uncharacterized protein YvpB
MLTLHVNRSFTAQYTINVVESDLSVVFIQLLKEHPVQVIHTNVDDKTKTFKCTTQTVHNIYTVDMRYGNQLGLLL